MYYTIPTKTKLSVGNIIRCREETHLNFWDCQPQIYLGFVDRSHESEWGDKYSLLYNIITCEYHESGFNYNDLQEFINDEEIEIWT